MKYQSTRGGETGLSIEDVLLSGYAKDHGLYMPESVPFVDKEELNFLSQLTYPKLVFRIVRKFISIEEISDEDLRGILDEGFSRFPHPDVITTKHLDENFSIVELFHGATLSFKDVALCLVGAFIEYFLKKNNTHIIAIVGTSGDTGGAAIECVRGKENIDIIVVFPKDRCTKIQKLHMTTVKDSNVHVYEVDGTSDELDVPIKQCFEDPELVKDHYMITMNSLNWTRIMAQIPMYFYAYFKLTSAIGDSVELIVPTGAAGNITAGCLAKQMGLPVRIVLAVNENDILARAFDHGQYTVKEHTKRTLSSAMDIQTPYNMERILFLFSDFNGLKVKSWMETFKEDGKLLLPKDLLNRIQATIANTHTASDEEVLRVMMTIYEEYQYQICPHTAVAVSYHLKNKNCSDPRGAFATASPAKFPEAVAEAGLTPITKGIEHLKDEAVTQYPRLTKDQDWRLILKAKIQSLKRM